MKQLNHNVALRVKLTQDVDTARETIQHLQVANSPIYPVSSPLTEWVCILVSTNLIVFFRRGISGILKIPKTQNFLPCEKSFIYVCVHNTAKMLNRK